MGRRPVHLQCVMTVLESVDRRLMPQRWTSHIGRRVRCDELLLGAIPVIHINHMCRYGGTLSI